MTTIEALTPQAGWMVVRHPDWIRAFYHPLTLSTPLYSIPTAGNPKARLGYRGLDRPMLQLSPESSAWVGIVDENFESERPALEYLSDLAKRGHVHDDLIDSFIEARELVSRISEPSSWDFIWATRQRSLQPDPGAGLQSLGYEPNYFGNDHFSPLCDALFFPRWHGTDQEGMLFAEAHRSLNHNGLFESPDEASAFLRLYLDQEWTEHDGEYFVIHIYGSKDR